MTDNKILISCENITLGYDGKELIKGLSFQVKDGSYTGIIGENGAGKTTLMKGILGLHKILDGKISFLEGLKQTEIGYIPQQSSLQKDFPATVMEVVLSGRLSNHGLIAFYNKTDKEKAINNMNKMGIDHLKNKSYRELSGGQQQRVLMARALCAAKKVLFLDEPMAGLDPESSEALYKILDDLKQEGMTILMVSHDLNGVFENADHILEITKEKIFFGTKEEYRNENGGDK
ncbi:MAG: metal ABC transporter ATP-binding protein [Aminipila sp.]